LPAPVGWITDVGRVMTRPTTEANNVGEKIYSAMGLTEQDAPAVRTTFVYAVDGRLDDFEIQKTLLRQAYKNDPLYKIWGPISPIEEWFIRAIHGKPW
jgi:hypothetical protein